MCGPDVSGEHADLLALEVGDVVDAVVGDQFEASGVHTGQHLDPHAGVDAVMCAGAKSRSKSSSPLASSVQIVGVDRLVRRSRTSVKPSARSSSPAMFLGATQTARKVFGEAHRRRLRRRLGAGPRRVADEARGGDRR